MSYWFQNEEEKDYVYSWCNLEQQDLEDSQQI